MTGFSVRRGSRKPAHRRNTTPPRLRNWDPVISIPLSQGGWSGHRLAALPSTTPILKEDGMREDTPGRANVEDTPELLAYYSELERYDAGALWTVANTIEPWQPRSDSVPVMWRYRDLREHVLRSADLVSPEKAGRRVIYLANPKRRHVSAAVGWLYTGLQMMRPGEAASAHAHSASALRFIMEGTGAYTIVDGHKVTLGANDFVLTPNGTWHEHGVSNDGTPCVWQDGLDIPLVNALEANFYAVHPDLRQKVVQPANDSTAVWGAPGLRPADASWSKPYSPLLH